MPFQFYLSNLVLLFRYKNLTFFNTSNLKSFLSKKVIGKSEFNFIYNLYNLNSNNGNTDKKYDFIVISIFRIMEQLKEINFINILKQNYKIVTVGEKLDIAGVEEKGLSRNEVLDLCRKNKIYKLVLKTFIRFLLIVHLVEQKFFLMKNEL